MKHFLFYLATSQEQKKHERVHVCDPEPEILLKKNVKEKNMLWE